MHGTTKAILLKAAQAALLQNASGNLASHVPAALQKAKECGFPDHAVVEHELKVLGLLGSGNGGYLT
ncbi:hypothetical protein [Pseudomonas phage Almagne]|nr:hypothetical protein [Pseudomonas phage Almagne]